MALRTVSSTRLRPLPLPIRIYNAVGKVSPYRPIHAEELMSRAQKQSRLRDFGPEDFLEPLEQLVTAINSEAKLHAFGHFVAQRRLVNLLNNRLRAVDWWKRHPEILEEKIAPPVLVAGMQRTGTTLMHRLLDLDPRLRAVKSWEALNPAPYTRKDPQSRIREARTSEKGLKYLAPDFFAIHPVEHLAPEEDVLLLDISMRSTVAEATMHVPSFSSWLQDQSQLPAYQFMRDLLKLMQWPTAKRQWILKSPHHLEWLETAEEVFPGTKYIQTHRHPREIVPSLCSMIYHGRVIFSGHNDPKEVGSLWINKMERLLDQSMRFRESHSRQFLDVDYRAFVSNPMATMHSVYDFLGLDLDENHEERIDAFLRIHRQHRFGKHQYVLGDFTDEDIMQRPVFANYVSRFNL
ncbi:MAG: sulfotransferase [Bacteroidota bacterium]